MPAYLMSVFHPAADADPADMQERYPQAVTQLVDAFDGRYLLRHAEARTIEGTWTPGHIVLVEFPSMSRLLEFYESDEYRPWLELRQRSGETDIVVSHD